MSCSLHDHKKTSSRSFEHHNRLIDEIACHLPYAILSVALAIIAVSLLPLNQSPESSHFQHRLFHCFHFLHLLFAGTGTILTFRRYSKNIFFSLVVGILVPIIFCTLSDVLLPHVGGKMLSVEMDFHWCFISHLDNVLPFLFIGIVNGWLMSNHQKSQQIFYSIGFHFFHILISSMASILYLISFGFHNWSDQMGFVFLYIIFVTLIPCTLADIVVPTFFAKLFSCQDNVDEKHNAQ